MRALRLLFLAALVLTAGAVSLATADDGTFGVFFDRSGLQCTGSISSGGVGTLYVVLMPSGSTYAGIHGAEFRVTLGSGELVSVSETFEPNALPLGAALGSGVTVGFASCRTGTAIPVMSFQLLASGAARDVNVRVTAKQSPSNNNFQCPLAVLCDEAYTSVCVTGGRGIVNPGSPRPCGASRESSEWTRMKEFYR